MKIKDDREHIVVCVVSTPICCNFSLSKSVILRKINHFIFFNIVVRLVFVSASGCYSFHKREKKTEGPLKKMDNPEKLATKGTQDEEKQRNMCWTPLYANKYT